MVAHNEIELKLEVPADSVRQIEKTAPLRKVTSAPVVPRLTSVYFDTRDFQLRKKGISLKAFPISKKVQPLKRYSIA